MMGLYTKLPEDIREVDVIVAGGKQEVDQLALGQTLKLVPRRDSSMHRSRKTSRSRSQLAHSGH
jgi:hypothetical protein